MMTPEDLEGLAAGVPLAPGYRFTALQRRELPVPRFVVTISRILGWRLQKRWSRLFCKWKKERS